MKKTALYFLLFAFSFSLFAQDKSHEVYRKTINHMGPNDTEFLLQLIESEDFSTPIKVLAVGRIGQLVESGNKKVTPKAADLMNKLSAAFKANPENGLPKNQEKIRRAVCLSLSQFKDTDQKGAVIDLLKDKISTEKNLIVYGACMQALVVYIDHDSDKIIDVLLTELLKYAFPEDPGYSDENIARVQNIVTAMGDTKSKKAFVPLLKVLEAALPATVKKQAEVSIDKIDLNS